MLHRTSRTTNAGRYAYTTLLAVMGLFLGACEDGGNGGNDNLLTGGSLVAVVIIGVVIFLALRNRR